MKRSVLVIAALTAIFCQVRAQQFTRCNENAATGDAAINKQEIISLVFPNPCRNELQVRCASYPGNTMLEIYNAAGQLVLQEELRGTGLFMDVRRVARGMYQARITSAGQTLAQEKFVKE
jgi:hypothetical protein